MSSSSSTSASASGPGPAGASGPPSRGRLWRLGGWCARHPVVVLAGWLLVLVGAQVANHAVGGAYSDDFSLPGTQAQEGADVLSAHEPAAGGTGAQVVLHDGQPLTQFQAQVDQAVTSLQHLPHVLSAQNPLPPPGQAPQPGGPLAADGLTAYVTVRFDGVLATFGNDYLDQVDAAVAPLRQAGVEVEYGGPLGELARPEPSDRVSELIGFGVAVVVLLAGFGSVVAAGLPLVSALVAVVLGLGLLGLLAALTTFATVAPTLATMIGLGVGIDYALFLLTRHRQNLMDGRDPGAAAGHAVATSGRAVLISGTTVVVALAGLSVSGISFVAKLGLAAAVTVVTAVCGALTLLPALLGVVGRRMDRFTVRPPVAEGTGPGGASASGLWHRYARRVERRPWWYLAAGLVTVLVLAVPLPSIRLGHVGDGADPASFTDRRAFDLMSAAFGPGSNGPLTVVVDQGAVAASDRPALAAAVQQALTGVPDAAGTAPLETSADGDVLFTTVTPAQAPQSQRTTDLVGHLSDTVLPDAVRGTPATTYVTGTTAAQVDFLDLIAARLLPIIAVVVALAFLIILLVFRAPLVALKAAVLNLVSIAASYGVLVAVFQWGWGGPALGVAGKVPIESYVPMMMFAIVFGLSMDYEVFLLSRVHEHWRRTGDSRGAVAHALETTARVIGCAALIMVSVFAAFVVSDDVVVKMMGLGLAVSVLIDATVVRLLMVPAAMTLLGDAAWWTPRLLGRLLPDIDAEGSNVSAR
ncbi:RND superfamily putative drug exporter [Kitasatospora sp. SolWspMP-SS2h]|uniref:MMPL family transporter n=1 Tax=Kitasatospora sp. SolWspMP-SS2h TaxID=1305729 RepID=UPI000DBAB1D6|nr:MMPL family transporter [Kitasatospora sp. SolWspMP-SS2h]RAJ44787.1 RND superfamily putative drug exporter [Kitasatospora sp. SolWspMP-SS2h]